MPILQYWTLPMANGKKAILMTSSSHTEMTLVPVDSLSDFIAQMESVNSLGEHIHYNS